MASRRSPASRRRDASLSGPQSPEPDIREIRVRGASGFHSRYGVPRLKPTIQTASSMISMQLQREKNIQAGAALRKAAASVAVMTNAPVAWSRVACGQPLRRTLTS